MAATRARIEVRGRRTLTFQADVSDFAHAHAIVERSTRKWDSSTCSLNKAGRAEPKADS